MIVVEDKLAQAFDLLPEIQGFKPRYESGNDIHLNKYLKEMADSSKSPYPLIYQVSNKDEGNNIDSTTKSRLVFVLATREKKTELLNSNRLKMSFKNVLIPLCENMFTLFNKAGIFIWDGTYTVEKFYNYGDGENNKTIDIWDALRLTIDLGINENCINKNIKF